MIRNTDTRHRSGDWPRLLPTKPPKPPAPAAAPDRAYEAWLMQMIAEDRADCAPYFDVSANG
jgi:hypothetical protein